MNEILQEFVDSRGVEMRVDREHGILRGVKLLGLQSRNGRKYLPAALAQAAKLYEGAKVNVNHPKGSPLAARDYQDRLGAIRNVRAGDGGLFGDLHFNPKHGLAEQLLWDATHSPENVGFSHNVEARTSRQGSQTVVEAILKVQSVDLVADPATTSGLYESSATQITLPEQPATQIFAKATLDQLRAERPDLVEAIAGDAAGRMAQMQIELDRLRAGEAILKRRALAAQLLREFRLPDPDLADAATKPVVSELFMETLLAAPTEPAMRLLVQERADMLAAARKLEHGALAMNRPLSREQQLTNRSINEVHDVDSFIRAIS